MYLCCVALPRIHTTAPQGRTNSQSTAIIAIPTTQKQRTFLPSTAQKIRYFLLRYFLFGTKNTSIINNDYKHQSQYNYTTPDIKINIQYVKFHILLIKNGGHIQITCWGPQDQWNGHRYSLRKGPSQYTSLIKNFFLILPNSKFTTI